MKSATWYILVIILFTSILSPILIWKELLLVGQIMIFGLKHGVEEPLVVHDEQEIPTPLEMKLQGIDLTNYTSNTKTTRIVYLS